METSKLMLEARNLAKTFNPQTANEVRALAGVDLAVEEGSWVVVVGTNGSGKSSLLNAIAGAFFVDAGTISLAGQDLTSTPEHERAKIYRTRVSEPFQRHRGRHVHSRKFRSGGAARDAARTGWALGSDLKQALKERVRRLNLGLEDRLGNSIGSLSGGQRQALTLLMATWVRPKLLLLDEHTAALDPKSADQVIRLTEDIVSRDKLTTLMVTHSMQQAASLGDRLVMMHRGRIIHDLRGAEKRRARVDDLLARFEEVRRREQLDETAAEMLRRAYI